MSVVRSSTRLPRIAAGPPAATPGAAHDGDWSEIEALLSSPEPVRGRRRTRGPGRVLAGLAALIATGGLVLAGLGGVERAGRPGPAAVAAAKPSTRMAVPPRTQVAIAPPRAAMTEGRSVATAASPPVPAPPGAVASIAPPPEHVATAYAVDAAGPAPRRHRHRREHRVGLAWRASR